VVVDDAIVDVDHIARRLRERRVDGSTRSAIKVILDASLDVRRPLIYATLILLLAATPFFFIPDPYGAFFQPLALSLVFALLAAMLVALTVTPALSLLLLARGS